MKLIRGNKYDCVACSLAMVMEGPTREHIAAMLFSSRAATPFPEPWDKLPKVPDMNFVCDWAWHDYKVAFVPFERNPVCSPAPECPSVPVWPMEGTKDHTTTPEQAFRRQLSYGTGLLEGTRPSRGLGHMCAWDGQAIYDPRGHVYLLEDALEHFDFVPLRFWLAVYSGQTRKL